MGQPAPEIEVVATPSALLVRVHEAKLDAPLAMRLVQAVLDGFPGDPRPVVLNLAGVTYVNSTGISAIARLASARDLWLAALRPRVAETLEMFGLFPQVEQAPTEADALRAIDANAGGRPP